MKNTHCKSMKVLDIIQEIVVFRRNISNYSHISWTNVDFLLPLPKLQKAKNYDERDRNNGSD
jgi:hypothetical protein